MADDLELIITDVEAPQVWNASKCVVTQNGQLIVSKSEPPQMLQSDQCFAGQDGNVIARQI